MTSSPQRTAVYLLALLLVVGAGVAVYLLVPRRPALPQPGTREYLECLRAFQVGVAALDAPEQIHIAKQRLDRVLELAPDEPAGWANRGLYHLRSSAPDLKQAAHDLDRAHKLAPDSAEIESLLGFLADQQGKVSEAVAHMRRAMARNPHDLPTIYALAEMISKEGDAQSNAEHQKLMEQILKFQPNNLKVLMDRAKDVVRAKDQAAFRDTMARLDRLAPGWAKENTRKKLEELKNNANSNEAIALVTELNNVLMEERGYKRDSAAVKPNPGFVGAPLLHFLRLAPPKPSPAPPDTALSFAPEPIAGIKPDKSPWNILQPLWRISPGQREAIDKVRVDKGGLKPWKAPATNADYVAANGNHLRAAHTKMPPAFPGGPGASSPTRAGVVSIDWNNDLRMDLLLAGAGGLRFFQQQLDGTFADVTSATSLPAEVLGGNYFGAWAADLEMDGDLDLIVARRSGPPLVLRNNDDGTFTPLEGFKTVSAARAFTWADLDNDGASDAAFLDDKGKLHVFSNERSGMFESWPVAAVTDTFLALTVADVNDDGVLDLVAVRSDGVLLRIANEDKGRSWQTAELVHGPVAKEAVVGNMSLLAGDLDNNGVLDLVLAGPRQAHIFLADELGKYSKLGEPIALQAFAILDTDGDGRLDLVGLSADGQPTRARNQGTKNYHWQVVWPLGNPKEGDRRVNSFGIGSEVEIRAGLLVQKQPAAVPAVHFGLGEQKEVDVRRIVWPNGVAQVEFEVPDNPLMVIVQRLSGSCPFLFTHDGAGMHFAGDFMWGTPLGMYVNGQNTGSFPQTTEWLKIPGRHLVPRDGYYDVRVTANLWEADYFDELALIVVDHPPGTEIYVDERFFLTPTKPRLHVTTPVQPVARAWDHEKRDATDLVQAIDGRYLDRCGRGRYQGITRDHWVEVDLGDDAPTEGPLLLVARGWIHPTNSSINVAISQGRHEAPQPLSLEVPDGKGGWKVARPALGFPAGRNKNMIIRLDGIDGPGVSRRFRLRTNLEIFWDFLGYARELDPGQARLVRPMMAAAELRYRGILETTQKDASSPEIPHYDKAGRGGQPWRDLAGYYTRFGDVRELLEKVDDRFVIVNAGDEIAFRFPVPEAPPAGWQRDFIWESDGWTRDGDLNTRFGRTVLPLPSHTLRSHELPPGRLEDDPVYKLFPRDWRHYHTRYVSSDVFERGLRTFRRPTIGR
jgi:Tfp pilus assembly protein PilF